MEPDVVTYNSLMDGYCQCGQLDKAGNVIDFMVHNGIVDPISYNILISGYWGIDEALTLFEALEKCLLEPDHVCYTMLIDGLCKKGLLDEAYKVFRGMKDGGCLPNDCCYFVIIQGFLKHGDVPKASQLIEEMVGKGFSGVWTILYPHWTKGSKV
ncbi:putative pentatricopeptide repeat-containing protein At1g12700, mitochondrial [Hevea brasiliensis]|uniref:putative pentatricopeptide repeat-containing protein At1g12700, mitochondrial n=1 Tax=Hevea brasiliensis TaxID=3981 RepID=UPI00260086B2|nr:putative pentatricopeptide repeat-containing protein At1g12700, mitochondrial [Hevea brasiliensis]